MLPTVYKKRATPKDKKGMNSQNCPNSNVSNEPSPSKRLKRSEVLPDIKEGEKICFICRKVKKLKHDKKSYERTISCKQDVEEKKPAIIRKDEVVI